MNVRWILAVVAGLVGLAGCSARKPEAELKPANPDDPAAIEAMVRAMESNFRRSVADGSMKKFRGSVAAQWREEMTLEAMDETFLPALAPMAGAPDWLTAQFVIERPPETNEEGNLSVALRYPGPLYHLFVEHVYVREDGGWKLGGYFVNARRFDERWEALLKTMGDLSREGRTAEAVVAADEALQVAATLDPPDPGLILTSVDNLCRLHLSRMDLEATLSPRLLALTVLARAVDPDHLRVAEELDQLFMAYSLLGRKEEAALCEAWAADVRAAAEGKGEALKRLREKDRLETLASFKPAIPGTPAAIMISFIRSIHAGMRAAVLLRGVALPEPYETLFSAIEAGDRELAGKTFAGLREAGGKVGIAAQDPDLANDLFQQSLEAYGAFEQFATWTPDLLDRFARGILESIPERAVYFGGTDAGRFILTAYRDALDLPFLVLSQNMLADHGYMTHLRTAAPPDLKLPSAADLNAVFTSFSEAIKDGRLPSSMATVHEDGRVTVDSPMGIMALNGQLSKMIFEMNKADRAFVVEVSHVLPWMIPHLEPAGLVMKLNPEPVHPLSADVAAADRAVWERLVGELRRHPSFADCAPARQSFSRLRASIGGLYAADKNMDEAIGAFRQALELCPESEEFHCRLAGAMAEAGRAGEAIELLETHLKREPGATQARILLDNLQRAKGGTD